MGDVGIESTLVLDGLAVSKVRFYSTLDSDVGKRVEITDKFNPLNVFTGTFDESLNLLYDLPAFTSYRVKMYGLDGETVESDQSFMLKGYDYLEKNVGLNKNSFAGIKAIVDQGLEDSMIDIGHEFNEDDGYGDNGGRWVVVAKNLDDDYRHSVYLGRKTLLKGNYITCSPSVFKNRVYSALNTYYESLPTDMKNAITARNVKSFLSHVQDPNASPTIDSVKVWFPSWKEVRGTVVAPLSYNNTTYSCNITFTEDAQLKQFQHYAVHQPIYMTPDGLRRNFYFRSFMRQASMGFGNVAAPLGIADASLASNTFGCTFGNSSQESINTLLWPHVMIASDPIE